MSDKNLSEKLNEKLDRDIKEDYKRMRKKLKSDIDREKARKVGERISEKTEIDRDLKKDFKNFKGRVKPFLNRDNIPSYRDNRFVNGFQQRFDLDILKSEEDLWQELEKNQDQLREVRENLQTREDDLFINGGLSDHIEEGIKHLDDIYKGIQVGLDIYDERLLEETQKNEIILSIDEKTTELLENLGEAYDEIHEVGRNHYHDIKTEFEEENGLGVTPKLPEDIQITGEMKIDDLLYELSEDYLETKNHFENKAEDSQRKFENIEDLEQHYRDKAEELGDSIFAEEYSRIADQISRKADPDMPQTYLEKADEAEKLAERAESAAKYLEDLNYIGNRLEEGIKSAQEASKLYKKLIKKRDIRRTPRNGDMNAWWLGDSYEENGVVS